MRTRIDHTHPALASAIREATADRRRLAASVAVARVLMATGLSDDPEIAYGLDRLLATGGPDAMGESDVAMYAQGLDSLYWTLEQAGEPGALEAFSRARAAAALRRALADDDASSLDAVYEAIHALDEPGALIAEVERLLTGPGSDGFDDPESDK